MQSRPGWIEFDRCGEHCVEILRNYVLGVGVCLKQLIPGEQACNQIYFYWFEGGNIFIHSFNPVEIEFSFKTIIVKQ